MDHNNQNALGIMLVFSTADKGEQSISICTIDYIWHDFIKPDHVNISSDNVFEKFKNTWGEKGVGVQIPVAKQNQICGDVCYEHDFSISKHQIFHSNIRLKVMW